MPERSSIPEPRTPHPRPRGHLWSLFLLVVLAVALLAVACDDDAEGEVDADLDIREITVQDESVEPDETSVRIPDQFDLVVANESDQPCAFFFGPWVKDLDVAPGEVNRIEVAIAPTDESADQLLPMGCEGDDRTGTIEVQEQLRPGGTGFD